MRRIIAQNSTRRAGFASTFQAFTLIEVLVSIGVIALLVALSMPAVQQVRENARKLQCTNNLRQLGIACAEYEATFNVFPLTTSGSIDGKYQKISCQARLLPFLDQTPIYTQIDFSEEGYGANSSGFPTSPVNQALLAVKVPVFLCPSDSPVLGVNYRANYGIGPSWTDFGAAVPTGAFRNFRSIAPHQFTDGLSNTIFFSEKLTGDFDEARFTLERDYFFVNANTQALADAEELCYAPNSPSFDHDSYGGSAWLFGGWRDTWYNHVRTPNSPGCDCTTWIIVGGDGAHTARSQHRGGVNVVKGDAAVSFIADAIDIHVWRALSTRNGGEVIDGQ